MFVNTCLPCLLNNVSGKHKKIYVETNATEMLLILESKF